MKYLESRGLNVNIKNRAGQSAYFISYTDKLKTRKYIIKNKQYKINKYNYIYLF